MRPLPFLQLLPLMLRLISPVAKQIQELHGAHTEDLLPTAPAQLTDFVYISNPPPTAREILNPYGFDFFSTSALTSGGSPRNSLAK